MATTPPAHRIGIFGPEEPTTYETRGCSLWPVGYAAAVTAAGATPVVLGEKTNGRSWADLLDQVDGLIWTGGRRVQAQPTSEEERLCHYCWKNGIPLLAIDQALHALNVIHGGTLHLDLAVERPEALQHRHPPETGLRHAIMVPDGTRLAEIYGEGELVVNSEHRRGVAKIARGFRVCATALDGVVEAIEADGNDWFAIGVQWRPASATASGLDIQLFRGLIDACESSKLQAAPRRGRATVGTAA